MQLYFKQFFFTNLLINSFYYYSILFYLFNNPRAFRPITGYSKLYIAFIKRLRLLLLLILLLLLLLCKMNILDMFNMIDFPSDFCRIPKARNSDRIKTYIGNLRIFILFMFSSRFQRIFIFMWVLRK